MRTSSIFLITLALLSAGLAGTAASPAGAASKAWIPDGDYGPILVQRPSTLEVDFRNDHSGLAFLHWTSWGGSKAVAYGEYGEFCHASSPIGGRPSCTSDDYTNRFAKVELSKLRRCKVGPGDVRSVYRSAKVKVAPDYGNSRGKWHTLTIPQPSYSCS